MEDVSQYTVEEDISLSPSDASQSPGDTIKDNSQSPDSSKCCRLTYIHQLGSTVMPFFSKDLLGVSSLLEKMSLSVRNYVLTS